MINKQLFVILLLLLTFYLLLSSGCVNTITETSSDPIVGTWKYEKPLTLSYHVNYSNYKEGEIVKNTTYDATVSYPEIRVIFYENHTVDRIIGNGTIINGSQETPRPDKPENTGNVTLLWTNINNGYYSIGAYNQQNEKITPNTTFKLENGYLDLQDGTGKLIREN